MTEVRDLDARLHEHAGFLRAIARRLAGDPTRADDLVQETFVRALAQRPSAVRSLRGWLATIVRNVFRDQRDADRARARREDEVARSRDDERRPGDDPFAIELLSRALQALPRDYRAVLQRRYYAQRSVAEIASELGVPEATVKTRLHRGLVMLRTDLEQRSGGRDGLRRALAPLLVPVPFATVAAVAPPILSTILMKKWLLGAAMLLVAGFVVFVTPPRGDGAAPSEPVAAAVDPVVANLEARAVANNTSADGLPSAPAEREVAGASDAARVQGRVVYAATREGVPFLAVSVRDERGRETVTTNRDGAFRTARAFAATAEVSCEGLRAPKAKESGSGPALDGTSGLPKGEFVILQPVGGGAPIVREKRGDGLMRAAASAESWERVAELGGPATLEIEVDLGPTYFVTLTPPAGSTVADLSCALGRRDDVDIAWLRDWSATQGPVHEEPDVAGRFWCRPRTTHRATAANGALAVFTNDGLWRSQAAVREVVGVQEDPVTIVFASAGVVTGVVRDPSGAPRAKQWVVMARTSATSIDESSARTDADGRYRITHVLPGPARLEVTGETVLPWREAIEVLAGTVTERDIVVSPRPQGGAITGTITTESGDAFRMCSVILTSRDDASIWRTANIEWSEVDGRQQATWSFANVPGIRCEATLELFEPCGVVQRRFEIVPPAAEVAFHVLDRIARQRVTFRPDDAARVGDGGWAVHVVGDAGWQLNAARADAGPLAIDAPVGQAFAWRVVGESLRARAGRLLVPAEPCEVVVPVARGYSTELHCMDIANFYAARGVEVFADGSSIGRTDADGVLPIDREVRPRTLALDPDVWRIFHDSAHRSDVDATTGEFHARDARGTLHVYVKRVL